MCRCELLVEEPTDEDASQMVWPCERCGGGDTDSGAVICEGPLCYGPNHVSAEDSRALCYPCAGVTRATVHAAPAFICTRCVQ